RAGAQVHGAPPDDRAVLGVDGLRAVVAGGEVAAGDDEADVGLVLVEAEEAALVGGERAALDVAGQPVAGQAGQRHEDAQEGDEPSPGAHRAPAAPRTPAACRGGSPCRSRGGTRPSWPRPARRRPTGPAAPAPAAPRSR